MQRSDISEHERLNSFYKQMNEPTYKENMCRVVLIANVESRNELTDMYCSILDSYAYKWDEKYDPERASKSRLKFIYLSADDKLIDPATNPKFKALQALKPGDQIEVIGHSYPGSDAIMSDAKKETVGYSFADLSKIIIGNVKKEYLTVNSNTQLPIFIKLQGCCTAKNNVAFFKPSHCLSKSMAEKMANYFAENNYKNIIVRGRLYNIAPVPTKKGYFLNFALRSFLNAPLTTSKTIGFHKLNYALVINRHFFSNFNPIPHNGKKTKPYKMDFMPALNPTTKASQIHANAIVKEPSRLNN